MINEDKPCGCGRNTIEELNSDEQRRCAAFEEKTGVKLLEVAHDAENKIRPTLINGRPVDRGDWLEVVRIGNRSCTGTIVGRNAVLTAAHCGRNNSRSTLEVYNGGRINYRMIHHPRYSSRGAQWDVAVLVLDDDVPESVKPATVGINYQFRNGADVDLLGYGCTRPGGGGGNDGILRFGESKVVSFSGTDVVTRWRPNGGALCFGDSGGPMFADGSNRDGATRQLIAINSKGNIRDTNYNMRLSLDGVKSWLVEVAERYDLEIHGVTTDEPEPEPPDDPSPPSDQFAQAILAHAADLRAEADEIEETVARFAEESVEPGECDEPRGDSGFGF